jgi:hypothetical protein
VGKASSSKKVQRAARAAATSRGVGEKRERGFPLLVLAVVVLGIGLVLAARSSREEAVAPFRTDHWHSAYEIYECGVLRPSLQTQTDPDGIHTHGDSLIHIHPFNSSATGDDARLGVFLDASGLEIDEEGIDSSGSFDAGFAAIDNATGCDGADSEIVVTRWNIGPGNVPEVETTYRGDFRDIQFLHEREAFTMAKVPVGEDAPPPTAAVLAQLDASTGTTNLASADFELPPVDDSTDTDTDTDPDAEADPDAESTDGDPDVEPETDAEAETPAEGDGTDGGEGDGESDAE